MGMQCAAIEYARNVCGLPKADSTEFNTDLTQEEQVFQKNFTCFEADWHFR